MSLISEHLSLFIVSLFTDPTRVDVVHGLDHLGLGLGLGLGHGRVRIHVLEAVDLVLGRGRALEPNRRQNSCPHYESLVRQRGGRLDPDRTAIRNDVPGQTINLPAADQDPGALKVAKDESIVAAVVVKQAAAKL